MIGSDAQQHSQFRRREDQGWKSGVNTALRTLAGLSSLGQGLAAGYH
jgi:hypothetical protein